MIIRNINSEIVKRRWYTAHGGARATMLFHAQELEGVLFFAHAELERGKILEEHVDPYEEIYYIVRGGSMMKVGGDEQQVIEGDAILIPHGTPHAMVNNTSNDCTFVVAAGEPLL